MTFLYADIETIPAQRPDVLEEIRATEQAALDAAIAAVKPPSNYGSEAAAKWMAEKGEAQIANLLSGFDAAVDAAYRKTGLDGSFGNICAVGWALDDDRPACVWGMDEADVLRRFFAGLRSEIDHADLYSTCVVGHNVAAFDLRFLAQRSIVLNIRPHPVIGRAAQAKPWESDRVYDTMVQWAGVGGKISLDKLCKALGIPTPKTDITGATVWDAVKAGRLEDVAEYCLRDVEAVRQVHRRMTFRLPVEVPEFEDIPA